MLTLLRFAAVLAAFSAYPLSGYAIEFQHGPVRCVFDGPNIQSTSLSSCAQGACFCATMNDGSEHCWTAHDSKVALRHVVVRASGGSKIFKRGPFTCTVDLEYPGLLSVSNCHAKGDENGGRGSCDICTRDAAGSACVRHRVTVTKIK